MDEFDVGPIDYLAVEFPDGQLKGEGLAAIIDLVDRGIVRVLDLRAVRKEQDGTLTAAAVADFDGDGASTSQSSPGSSPASSETTTCRPRPT